MLNSNYLSHVILSKAKDLRRASLIVKFFLFGFLICFLAEGIGIIPKNITFSLFLLFSLLLGMFLLRSRKQVSIITIPIFIGAFVYLLYLFYLSFFSLNVQASFEFTVFIASLFLVFIVVRNNWEQIEKPFLYSLLGLGVFFCIYSFFLPFVLQMNLFFFKPYDGYQYVYAMFGSNHLGEFLVFPMLISFSFFMKQKKNLFFYLFFFYFLFFLFSYSRAGYLGFFIGFLLLMINLRKALTKKVKIVLLCLFTTIIFFFLSTTFQSTWINSVPILSEILPIKEKSDLETREAYIVHGLKGFLAHRFYGVGLGNFAYASRMFTEIPNGWASSSHNLFIDILTETGAVSFIIFVIFAIFLLKTMKHYHTSLYAVLLLSWFVMAQFDYIHQMYSYLLLFPFFLVGVLCNKTPCHPEFISGSSLKTLEMLKRVQHDNKYLTFVITIALSLFLIIYTTSGVLLQKGNYTLSRTIYPLQKLAYEHTLNKEEILRRYIQLFPGEYKGWILLAKQYEKERNMSKAIENYEKSFWLSPFQDLSMAEKIYNLKKKYPGNGEPKWFADKLFKKLYNDTDQGVLSSEQWLFINTFCQKVYRMHCIYILQ